MADKKETPMMAQYRSIRRSLPEEIILFFGWVISMKCFLMMPCGQQISSILR